MEDCLPMPDAPQCVLHRDHSPRMLVCQEWTFFPPELQQAVGIRQADINHQGALMCPTGLMNVAVALQDLLDNDGFFKGKYSQQERQYAMKAFDMYARAKEARR